MAVGVSGSSSVLTCSLAALMKLNKTLRKTRRSATTLAHEVRHLRGRGTTLGTSCIRTHDSTSGTTTRLISVHSELRTLKNTTLNGDRRHLVRTVTSVRTFGSHIRQLRRTSIGLSKTVLTCVGRTVSRSTGTEATIRDSLHLLRSILKCERRPIQSNTKALTRTGILDVSSRSKIIILGANEATKVRIKVPIQLAQKTRAVKRTMIASIHGRMYNTLIRGLRAPTSPIHIKSSTSMGAGSWVVFVVAYAAEGGP